MGSSIIPGHAKREEEEEKEFGFFGSLTSSIARFLSFFRFFLSFLISLIRAPFKRFLKTFVVSGRFAFVWREMSGGKEERRGGGASIPGDDDVRTRKYSNRRVSVED